MTTENDTSTSEPARWAQFTRHVTSIEDANAPPRRALKINLVFIEKKIDGFLERILIFD